MYHDGDDQARDALLEPARWRLEAAAFAAARNSEWGVAKVPVEGFPNGIYV